MLTQKKLWMALAAILLIAAILTAGDGIDPWLNGWLAYTLLLSVAAASLYWGWKVLIGVSPTSGRAPRSLLLAACVAFLLRLCVGAALTQLLPVVGYADSAEHQAGYTFTDAYLRDRQAWQLARSDLPLSQSFSGEYSGDQYGGMLALSSLVYRYLSPDAQRPMLILVVTAAAAAWGVFFLWKASHDWFGGQIAGAAAWIMALYPESVLLGSSQMRESFVISAVAMSFYSLTLMPVKNSLIKSKPGWLAWLVAAGLILFLFQPPAALVNFAILFGLWLLAPDQRLSWTNPRTLGLGVLLAGILIIALLVVVSIWANLPSLSDTGPLSVLSAWLQKNFEFQSYLTERASGMFQKLLDSAGEQWKWLIVIVYGIAQPVLPAVVGDPDAAWIMRTIGFFRAAGWYALAPFLVYGVMTALRSKLERRRAQLIFLSLVLWTWIIIAALNGGGDQWDNPRYRTLILAWGALLTAWAWAVSRRDSWLWRWLAVEGVFVLIFTEWYASRYYPGLPHLDIFTTIAITLVLSAIILLGGWWRDRKHERKY